MMVGRVLAKLSKENKLPEIEKIDIMLHPRTALRAGITMIPTLEMNGEKLSGVFLSEEQIREFLDIAKTA